MTAGASDSALKLLLDPVETEEFFQSHWEKRPLLIQRGNPAWYQQLFNLDSVDAILTTTDLRQPAFRLVKAGEELAADDYTFDLGWGQSAFAGVADVDKILSHYQNGTSIVLQALHRNWPSIATFCRSLEKILTHSVQANAYLTPRGSQGLKPHYDTHCVFIVQVSGEKNWKIYGNPLSLPHHSQKHGGEKLDDGLCQMDCVLKTGDMLYIPRGVVHEALTGESHSLHLTVGVPTTTWVEVCDALLKEATKQVSFRSSLPLGYVEKEIPSRDIEQFRTHLLEFVQHADVGKMIGEMANKFVDRSSPSRRGFLSSIEKGSQVQAGQTVHLRADLIVRVSSTEEEVVLRFEGKTVSFPLFCQAALRLIFDAKERGVETSMLGELLSEEEALILLNRLAKEGLFEPKG